VLQSINIICAYVLQLRGTNKQKNLLNGTLKQFLVFKNKLKEKHKCPNNWHITRASLYWSQQFQLVAKISTPAISKR
jgi:hypothetical protein